MVPSDLPEGLLLLLAGGLRQVLELLSVLMVLIGLLITLRRALAALRGGSAERLPSRARLGFASWLALALEFQLGADIVATTISPSGATLIQLAAVAVIRTFLNVFLGREIEAERRREEHEETIRRRNSP